jgi:hypothetical protein
LLSVFDFLSFNLQVLGVGVKSGFGGGMSQPLELLVVDGDRTEFLWGAESTEEEGPVVYQA